MLISVSRHAIRVVEAATRSELATILEQCPGGSLWVGSDDLDAARFVAVLILPEYSCDRTFGVGLCCQEHGVSPVLLVDPSRCAILLGFSSRIVGITVPEGRLAFSLDLPSLFYSFFCWPNSEMILTFHELGVVAVMPSGDQFWSYDAGEVVQSWQLEGTRLKLQLMDGSSRLVDAETGSVARS